MKYSGEQLSLNKIIGQLQDAGNVTTLAGYLQLLDECGLLTGLQKYAADKARKYNSIPKFQVYNNALKNAYHAQAFASVQFDHQHWGRLVESAVGAHLVNEADSKDYQVYYWRERGEEVDFVIEKYGQVIGLAVKSGRRGTNTGLSAFRTLFRPRSTFVIGTNGISVEEFLRADVNQLFL